MNIDFADASTASARRAHLHACSSFTVSHEKARCYIVTQHVGHHGTQVRPRGHPIPPRRSAASRMSALRAPACRAQAPRLARARRRSCMGRARSRRLPARDARDGSSVCPSAHVLRLSRYRRRRGRRPGSVAGAAAVGLRGQHVGGAAAAAGGRCRAALGEGPGEQMLASGARGRRRGAARVGVDAAGERAPFRGRCQSARRNIAAVGERPAAGDGGIKFGVRIWALGGYK